MAPRAQIENDERFRALWYSDRVTESIALELGVSAPTVRRAAKRFGYPPRPSSVRKRVEGKSAEAQAEAEERAGQRARGEDHVRAEALSDRLALRGLPAVLALGLVRARTYADLEQLAEQHRQPLTRLLPLWHEVRA